MTASRMDLPKILVLTACACAGQVTGEGIALFADVQHATLLLPLRRLAWRASPPPAPGNAAAAAAFLAWRLVPRCTGPARHRSLLPSKGLPAGIKRGTTGYMLLLEHPASLSPAPARAAAAGASCTTGRRCARPRRS